MMREEGARRRTEDGGEDHATYQDLGGGSEAGRRRLGDEEDRGVYLGSVETRKGMRAI